MLDHFGLRTQGGRIGEEVAAAIKRGEGPCCPRQSVFGKTADEVLRSFSHDLGERPVLLIGDGFESLVKRIGKLNLGPRHDG